MKKTLLSTSTIPADIPPLQRPAAPEPPASVERGASGTKSEASPTQPLDAATSCDTAGEACAQGGHSMHPESSKKAGARGGAPFGNENHVLSCASLWKRKGRFPRRHKAARKHLVAEGAKVEAELRAEG